jgi:hypothetical protein
MKTMWQSFQLHDTTPRLLIYTNLMEQLKKDKNDVGISMLTSCLYKQEFRGEFNEEVSQHCIEIWLPRTLNTVGNGADFIMEIIESVQASLGMLVCAVSFERRMGK